MTLGILGGCGPAAGAHFYTRLIALTAAEKDSDHVDVLLSGRASTPDRTAYLLGGGEDPAAALAADARYLAAGGADLLVLLCHTAHAFLSEIRASVSVPVLDMVSLTVDYAAARGFSTLGILSTEGTYHARLYDRAAAPYGIRVMYPSASARTVMQNCIYGFLKQGRGDGGAAIRTACADLGARGCGAVVLACTELSLPAAQPGVSLYYRHPSPVALLPQAVIDPLEILARRAIALCGKQVKEEHQDAAAFFAGGPARCQTAGV